MTTSIKGASRRLPAVDMALKVLPSRALPEPTSEMPASSGKPPADWPTNPCKLESGLARPGRIGTMPSTDTPSR
jgi:hypothetical protein